jgi:hypothetical protein
MQLCNVSNSLTRMLRSCLDNESITISRSPQDVCLEIVIQLYICCPKSICLSFTTVLSTSYLNNENILVTYEFSGYLFNNSNKLQYIVPHRSG